MSLAFVSAAGFLGLHALATPGVLIGKNAGFELATPVGLMLAGLFAAASGLRLMPRAAERVLRFAWLLVGGLSALLAGWAIVSLAEAAPLAGELGAEQLDGWQTALAAVGVVLYSAAALGYYRLYRRRQGQFQIVGDAVMVIFNQHATCLTTRRGRPARRSRSIERRASSRTAARTGRASEPA